MNFSECMLVGVHVAHMIVVGSPRNATLGERNQYLDYNVITLAMGALGSLALLSLHVCTFCTGLGCEGYVHELSATPLLQLCQQCLSCSVSLAWWWMAATRTL
jgi:hypothetical protein